LAVNVSSGYFYSQFIYNPTNQESMQLFEGNYYQAFGAMHIVSTKAA